MALKIKVKNAADMVVATVCSLGFTPTDSIALLMSWPDSEAQGPPAMRIDVGAAPQLRDEVENLTAKYGDVTVGAAIFGDYDTAETVRHLLESVCDLQMVAVTDGITARCVCDEPTCNRIQHEVNLQTHPAIAEMVALGHGPTTEERIRTEVTPASNTVAGVLDVDRIAAHLGEAEIDLRKFATRAIDLWEAALAEQLASSEDVAHLVAATQIIAVRDVLWAHITPETSHQAQHVWAWIATRAPVSHAVPALTLAAFASWQAGDGYRSRLALEQAHRLDPNYSMASLVAAASATSPRLIGPLLSVEETWEHLENTMLSAT